ncbi:MAG: OsmC family peroxiredoxin [Myxococcales bacterium]|nr:OsmC family peroxiredoxin [Myxococcales bacterium]
MSEHLATVAWKREETEPDGERFSRAHVWEFDGGACMAASPSPHVLPPPMSVAANVDPEEAFVAALASCHMLFFLSLAARRGFAVCEYVDHASGRMERNEDRKMAVTQVTLRPHAAFSGERIPTPEEIEALHHAAHERCFLANSVRTRIVTDIAWTPFPGERRRSPSCPSTSRSGGAG